MGLVGLAVLLTGVGLLVAIPIYAGHFALGPLERAAQQTTLRAQFTLLDFFSLLVMLQAPLTILRLTRQPNWTGISGLLCFAALSAWWYGVGIASRAAIRRPLRRCVLVIVVVPVGAIGALSPPLWLLALITRQGAAALILLGALIALPFCRLYVNWLLDDAQAAEIRLGHQKSPPLPPALPAIIYFEPSDDRGPGPALPKQGDP